MNFDNLSYRYPSKRNVLMAKYGMVATSNPIAAQIGISILKKGGNAIDAAIGTAIALTVVEPTSNGIGGDNFAIVNFNNELYGINSSGYSPANLNINKFPLSKYSIINPFGWEAITVPGAVRGWLALSKRFGKLDFKDLFTPTIKYAREGFPLFPTIGYYWNFAVKKYKSLLDEIQFSHFIKNLLQNKNFEKGIDLNSRTFNQIVKNEYKKYLNTHNYFFKIFSKNGYPLKIGSTFHLKEHAKTLELIANTDAEAFYSGELTEKIINFSKKTNGFFEFDDFKNFQPEWVKPISINYRGFEIHELPPNTQGIAALIALGILNNKNIKTLDSSLKTHFMIESLKLGFYFTKKHVSDPKFYNFDYISLLKKEFLKNNLKKIKKEAQDYEKVHHFDGGTVYLATTDKDGNMVSFIQSNYMGFGSGIVIPGTGIALHNRGANFNLNLDHPNHLEPLKRPYHTIIPGFISKNKKPIGPFGVMGGFMQPQGHLQIISNLIDYNMNPQEALDCPRWQWTLGKDIIVEDDFDKYIVQQLIKFGHKIKISTSKGGFGRGQIILCNKNGVYIGGTEKRCDGYIAVY